MSVREDEDRHKNCPSRNLGLGVAVAAIGVGVGAALYYFMNKRQENPNTAGSTTRDWTCEPDHTLDETEDFEQNTDNSFTTISEHSTTDTSMNDSNISRCRCNDISDDMYSTVSESDSNSTQTDSFSDDSDIETESNNSMSTSDSDLNEWDITNSLEFPSYAPSSTRHFIEDYARNLVSFRSNNSRKRSWSLEECSICFDVILRDQEVMSLPCTHHFHTKCIMPWLQEQQTCPNCRKSVD